MALLKCPCCTYRRLTPVRSAGVEIDACTYCGGLWFDHNELDKIVHTDDPDYPRDGPIIETLGQKVTSIKDKECPRCQSALITHDFEKSSELKIDICESCHGIWLDKGELEHAQIFYEIPKAVSKIKEETTWGHWFFQFFLNLPVEFNIKPKRIPIITIVLIVLNVLLVLPIVLGPNGQYIWEQWGMIPAQIGSFHWIVTLFSSQFIHAGWLHLLMNMYFLYILGDNVEDAMGRVMFPLFYIFCGLIACLAHAGYEFAIGGGTEIPLGGASGAISGVIGAYVYIFRKAKLTFMIFVYQVKLSAFWYFCIWLATNIILMIAGSAGVSWMAHIGGFIAGIIFSYFVYDTILKRNPLIRYLNQGLTKQNS